MNPARTREPAAALALAVLSAATALAFDRVFVDGTYMLPTLGAALLPHGIGWGCRRRGWPATTPIVASLVGLVLYGSWMAAASTTFLGIPGPSTPDALLTTLADGWDVLRTGVAPVATSDGAVLLTVVAVWIMATAADALAFEGDASIGAVVPSLVVFVVASSLGPHELSIWGTAAYLAAALAFLALCHRELLEERRSWFTGRQGSRGVSLVGVAVSIGAAAVVVGLVIAPALPGADAAPLLDYKRDSGRGGGYQSRVNPLVDIKSRLTRQRDVELFRVEAESRQYWRLVALDQFDGTEWTLSSNSRRARGVLTGPATGSGTVPQRFRITGLDERWLPAAYEPTAINLPGALVVPESRTLLHREDSIVGLRYRVVSRVAPSQPSAAQIAATTGDQPASLDRYRQLPDDFPEDVRRSARQLTADAATPYDAARNLESFFTSGSFTYDLDVPAGSGDDAIREFLRVRRGFCEQFAGTYAAMARAVGLPTRVAVGFTPGTYDDAGGAFAVTGRNAHAWPEVWFPGLGWTRFEPTPAGDQPGATDPTGEGTAPGAAEPQQSETTSTSTVPGNPTPTTAPVPGGRNGQRVAVTADRPDDGAGPGRAPWIAFGAVLAVVAALAVRVVRGWASRSRRRRARRGGAPRDAVVGAWAEAVERLGDHGVVVARTQTPREVVDAVDASPERVAVTCKPLARLADATALALWSPTDPGRDAADQAWTDLGDLERLLREQTTRGTRLRRSVRTAFSAATPTSSR